MGKRSEDKPRPIIARISNYEKRHQLIKESRNLRKVEGFESVSVNQELTKVRAKVAFECRKLVKEGRAKLTFVWDGKIFIVDNNDKKHLVVCINDLIMLDKLLVAKTEWCVYLQLHVSAVFTNTVLPSDWSWLIVSARPHSHVYTT